MDSVEEIPAVCGSKLQSVHKPIQALEASSSLISRQMQNRGMDAAIHNLMRQLEGSLAIAVVNAGPPALQPHTYNKPERIQCDSKHNNRNYRSYRVFT